LTINGKKNNLYRKDFDVLADYLNIPIKVRYDMFDNKIEVLCEIIRSSKVGKEKQDQFIAIINERYQRMDFI